MNTQNPNAAARPHTGHMTNCEGYQRLPVQETAPVAHMAAALFHLEQAVVTADQADQARYLTGNADLIEQQLGRLRDIASRSPLKTNPTTWTARTVAEAQDLLDAVKDRLESGMKAAYPGRGPVARLGPARETPVGLTITFDPTHLDQIANERSLFDEQVNGG
ncbi:hypothetical protein [Streptomyces hebeiensis]